jgi:hypothetical protein
MGRPKKVKTVEDYPEVAEMMVKCAQGDPTAIRAVGDYVENVLKSKFGKVLELYFRGKEVEIINRAKQDLPQAPVYLGMLSAVKEFALDLEQFVLDKDKVLAPVERDAQEEIGSPDGL